jgi:hypothetical protein
MWPWRDASTDLGDPPFPGEDERRIASTRPSAEPEPQIALEAYAMPDYRTEPVSVPVEACEGRAGGPGDQLADRHKRPDRCANTDRARRSTTTERTRSPNEQDNHAGRKPVDPIPAERGQLTSSAVT